MLDMINEYTKTEKNYKNNHINVKKTLKKDTYKRQRYTETIK